MLTTFSNNELCEVFINLFNLKHLSRVLQISKCRLLGMWRLGSLTDGLVSMPNGLA